MAVDAATLSLPRKRYEPDAKGPLAGVRVLDLTRLVSGAQLGLILGDLGADVVKIERPRVGDSFRHTTRDGYDAFWRAYARNKRSVTLDLADPRGSEILLRLAETADLLLENFTPGVLERLCGGPDVLLERNPRLVVVRISGWGQTGPRARQPGFGTLAEAFSGFTYLNGLPDGPPVQAPMSLADCVAGTYAASAALAALWDVRVNGGAGQVVDVSLFEPLLSIMGADATAYAANGRLRGRGDGAGVSSVRGAFLTSDEHLGGDRRDGGPVLRRDRAGRPARGCPVRDLRGAARQPRCAAGGACNGVRPAHARRGPRARGGASTDHRSGLRRRRRARRRALPRQGDDRRAG